MTNKGGIDKGGFSRRDFLKLSGAGLLFGMAARYINPNIDIERGELPSSVISSESVHGVDVFGLQTKIENQDQLDNLGLEFDLDFERRLTREEKALGLWEQRESILPRDSRLIEFVVTESAYQRFQDRKAETGVDYVEWIKLHIDLMNRAAKNAKPPTRMKSELSRVIVVSDKFKSNPMKYTKDIDAMWFNDADYRPDPKVEIDSGYFWSFKHDSSGQIVLSYPAGGDVRWKPQITLPKENDSFESAPDGVWLDCGLTHELSHQAWNLPDEYTFDNLNAPFEFKNFAFFTGAFHEPKLSPYLSRLLNLFIREKVRGYYTDPRGIGNANSMEQKYFHFGMIPDQIKLHVANVENVSAYKSQVSSSDYYSPKTFVEDDSTRVIAKDEIVVGKSLFSPRETEKGKMFSQLTYFKLKIGEKWKELCIPLAVFNMAKIEGINDMNCEIKFNEVDLTNKTSLQFEMIDDSEIDSYMKIRQERNFPPYATMKVNGLSTWFIWSAQK